MALAVDNPIINSPFSEPTRYWKYVEGQPVLEEGRRPAGYYLAARTRSATGPIAAEDFVELKEVNEIRAKVAKWRDANYPGVSDTTRELLRYWCKPERERKLFFCQLEAAETIIWLTEAPASEKLGLKIPRDEPNDPGSMEKGYKGLTRYACKMATGSGKTVVMAMIAAWSVLNKVLNRQDKRFSDAVLVVCPNVTVRERLQVLKPFNERNYYQKFELVPASLFPALQQGKYLVTNWHVFNPQDNDEKKYPKRLAEESDRAFCNRLLKDLGSKENILVLNDEAHHAYRPAQKVDWESLSPEERKEVEAQIKEATVWVSGLDRINAGRGINFCVDMSATPFYIKGSNYPEGLPFPWLVSDFGLVDAIESGIVKVPRVPVDDNSGTPVPRYFRLWEWINQQLPAKERQTARRRAKPEAVLRMAEDALATLASEWKHTFDEFQHAGSPVPPALIVVCDNTDLSKLVAEHVASGRVLPELENRPGQEATFRIDTKLLNEAESRLEGESSKDAAERLRDTINTIGKTEWEKEGDPPGRNVRCVVSVSMLTEGWDAQNVTQILGLRAFTSQLLCEQVVGRGLRRTNYDDFSEPEYADVYGVPYEVIPVKKKGKTTPQLRVSTLVKALPERKHLEITFPRVEGYIFDARHRIKADIEKIPILMVEPSRAPTEVIVKDAVGYRLGRPDRLGPGHEVVQDRDVYHVIQRPQGIEYQLAARVTNYLQHDARRFLFPQVLNIVREFLAQRVKTTSEAPLEEVSLLRYADEIVSRLCAAIEPDTEAGEPPLLPIIERFRPKGSTSEVLFRTVKTCYGTTKSHVSHVVADSPGWEHSVAYQLERSLSVIAYVKNDHLDFVIPYEYEGVQHDYRPDFIVRLRLGNGQEENLILEVKGFEREQDRAKETAARRWVKAVNYHAGFGNWAWAVARDPKDIINILEGTGKKSQ